MKENLKQLEASVKKIRLENDQIPSSSSNFQHLSLPVEETNYTISQLREVTAEHSVPQILEPPSTELQARHECIERRETFDANEVEQRSGQTGNDN